MSRFAVVLSACLLAGCSWFSRPPVPVPVPEPVDLYCSAECFVGCGDTPPVWAPKDPDSPEAWNELVEQVIAPLVKWWRMCETRRASCASCIERGRQLQVIR